MNADRLITLFWFPIRGRGVVALVRRPRWQKFPVLAAISEGKWLMGCLCSFIGVMMPQLIAQIGTCSPPPSPPCVCLPEFFRFFLDLLPLDWHYTIPGYVSCERLVV